ncbi:MBL fold metallo-hydrolase [Candidatus Woesearchaeota archaeon]|nr:MBL fold metallo-hydrolase [Candidatus Woesearchaeota archaeon]
MEIEWLGHAGFKISSEKVIFVDPYKAETSDKADIILVTHPHYDHFSIEDIRQISKMETVIIGPEECRAAINTHKIHHKEFKTILPGYTIAVYNCSITGVPAYNVTKHFHKKADGWVGFVIRTENRAIYHAGDTDFVQEMASIKADIAMLPVGGTYTMNAREAAQACNLIKPKIAIPMHYGSIIGSKTDAEVFTKSVAHSKVQVMEKNVPIEVG